MAYTYGSISQCKYTDGTTSSYYECRLGYQVNSQSIENNTSNITLRLEVRSTNSSYGTYGYRQTTTIDGTALSSAAFDMRDTNTWQVFGTRTITVTHNTSGHYSSSKAGSFTTTATMGDGGSYALKSGSASVTVAPPDIPRYATVTQELRSKTSSSISINWSSDSIIDYIWYSKDNGSTWTGIDITDGTSGNYTISSLTANTTYNIKTRVRRKDSQLTTDSTSLSITTYQKTIPTISLLSKTVNSITVNSSANVPVSSTQYRIKTSSGSYGGYQTSNSFTGLTPNTAYVVEVKKVGTASGETGTATLNVSTYDIAKLSSYPNFNLGNSETITYSNPSSSAINLGIYTSDGSTVLASYRSVSGSSYTFNFTDTELDLIYKTMGTSNALNARVYLRTTANNSNYYDYKSITISLTGNQKTGHLKVSSSWKRSKKWINVNGVWKRCVRWINVNGTWKRCI